MIKEKFRNNGAIGALLDEYEKAINNLLRILDTVSSQELLFKVDLVVKDLDCISIQTILAHIVNSGYNYTIIKQKYLGKEVIYKKRTLRNNVVDYQLELKSMFQVSEHFFDTHSDILMSTTENEKKIITPWDQLYDVDQLMEHAIVHILRHRRQIERFLIKIRS